MHHKSAEHAFQYAKAMRCGYWDAAKFINERGCFITAFTLFFLYILQKSMYKRIRKYLFTC